MVRECIVPFLATLGCMPIILLKGVYWNIFGSMLISDYVLYVSIYYAFLMAGTVLCMLPLRIISRKALITAIGVLNLMGYVIMAFVGDRPKNVQIAMALTGLANGMIYVTVPMYVSDIADKRIRGVLISLCLSIGHLGVILSDILGDYLKLSAACLSGANLLVIYFLPESPYYHFLRSHDDKVRESLKKLHCKREEEMEEMYHGIDREQEKEWALFVLVQKHSKSMCIVLLLILCQVYVFYTPQIFIKNLPLYITGLTACSGSIISGLSMDYFGRKITILTSSALALLLLSVIFLCKLFINTEESLVFYIASIFVLIPLSTILMSAELYETELFPLKLKAFAMGLCKLIILIVNAKRLYFNVKFASNYDSQYILEYTSLLLPAAFCGVAFVVAKFLLPETKGKSFSEIQIMLKEKPLHF